MAFQAAKTISREVDTVRVYGQDGSVAEVFFVDARELVASGFYSYEPVEVVASGKRRKVASEPVVETGIEDSK